MESGGTATADIRSRSKWPKFNKIQRWDEKLIYGEGFYTVTNCTLNGYKCL